MDLIQFISNVKFHNLNVNVEETKAPSKLYDEKQVLLIYLLGDGNKLAKPLFVDKFTRCVLTSVFYDMIY